MFQRGLQYLRAERWADAADQFDRAMTLRPTPEIAYNLASALLHMGQLVRASELLRHVGSDADANADVRRAAASRLNHVLPRIAYLAMRLDGPADDVTVKLDGRVLDDAMIGALVPVDPVRHVVVATRGSEAVYEQTLTVKEGERVPLTIVVPVALQRIPVLVQPIADRTTISAVPDSPSLAHGTNQPERLPSSSGASSGASSAASSGASSGRVWLWAAVGAIAAGTLTAMVLTARGGPQIEAGSVDTVDIHPAAP